MHTAIIRLATKHFYALGLKTTLMIASNKFLERRLESISFMARNQFRIAENDDDNRSVRFTASHRWANEA